MPILQADLHSHGKQDQESNHQTEETHSFRQGESQDSIWEQLLLQRRISKRKRRYKTFLSLQLRYFSYSLTSYFLATDSVIGKSSKSKQFFCKDFTQDKLVGIKTTFGLCRWCKCFPNERSFCYYTHTAFEFDFSTSSHAETISTML